MKMNQIKMSPQPFNESLPSLTELPEGILLVNKPKGKTSFALVGVLRRLLKVKKIGHAGTLDPFATGVMVMLIGKTYTKRSDSFLGSDKEYLATAHLGLETDSYDCDGQIISKSDIIPTDDELKEALKSFQGDILQIPPMFSAKKVKGKKLYELARQGISIEREAVKLHVKVDLIAYHYPFIQLKIACSKGTYIRSIAQDLGKMLRCGAILSELTRIRSGTFHLNSCYEGAKLFDPNCDVSALKLHLIP